MKKILFLLGMAWAVHSPAAEAAASRSLVAPAPLYRDPVHDGAADATLVWNRAEKCWWMLYTNRRADADDEKGVKWVHGTDIGIASTPDGGLTWTYRGIARGLEFETNGGRNTFWAPEVVDFGGWYHAFISYVRGVPETWKGTRDILHYASTNLLDWRFESVVVPGSIDACVHRLPNGRWRMWFKNEQRKMREGLESHGNDVCCGRCSTRAVSGNGLDERAEHLAEPNLELRVSPAIGHAIRDVRPMVPRATGRARAH